VQRQKARAEISHSRIKGRGAGVPTISSIFQQNASCPFFCTYSLVFWHQAEGIQSDEGFVFMGRQERLFFVING